MRDRRIAEIAAAQYGVFTTQQANTAGFTADAIRHQLRTGRWLRLFRGVYAIAGMPTSREQPIIAATLAFGPTAVASHVTAGWLWGLTRAGERVHLTMPHGQPRRVRRGVVLHQASLSRAEIRPAKGVRATSPQRTLVDLAAALPPSRLEAAVDTALLAGLVTTSTMLRYIAARGLSRRPGAGVLRALLLDRSSGVPQLEFERAFTRKLRKAGLPAPVRQFPVGRRRLDLAYPDAKIAIELDSLAWHTSGSAFRDDRRKQNELVLLGWLPLRFTWADMTEAWPSVERTLRDALNGAQHR